ncbi:MAG: diadenylate cyclase CdaA [Planctomycetota bacterium]
MGTVVEYLRDQMGFLRLEYLVEVLIIYLLIYTFLRFMEGTRGEGILKGIALIILTVPILVTIVAEQFQILDRLVVILRFFGAAAIPVIVIIVQPELRRALVRLGQTRIFAPLLKGQTEGMVDEIVKAAFRMSRRKIGALIAIEREVGLQNYVERGTSIDGIVSSEILSTIFFPGSDLHDGAVIIQKERIAAAGCLFPLSENPNLGSIFGTRHRAALGISEETDAIVVVVSEETGIVSFVHGGQMERPLSAEQLRSLLLKYYAQLEEPEPVARAAVRESAEIGRGVA